MPSEISFWIAYFGLGVLSLWLVAAKAKRHGVDSTLVQAASVPTLVIFSLALWPAFFRNDLFGEIPKERKERKQEKVPDEAA